MSRLTTDRNDPDLRRGSDEGPEPQNKAYLVLSEEERAKGYVRPLRTAYIHKECGSITTMGLAIAETYACDPNFYGATYCVRCSKHLPVSEFVWADMAGNATDEEVGS